MIVNYTAGFRKKFKKRIYFDAKLVKQFELRLGMFCGGENIEVLKIHELAGRLKGHFAFSVTGDIRVIFQKVSEEEIILVDIGSHNQVY